MKRLINTRKNIFVFLALLIGFSFLFLNTRPIISAEEDNQITINFKYVAESELSEQDKANLQQGLPSSYKDNDVFYMVYRAFVNTVNTISTKEVLPQTGHSDQGMAFVVFTVLIMAGILFYFSNKKGKSSLFILLITATVLSYFPSNTKALEANLLQIHNREIKLTKNQSLPDMKINIDGYEYLGFIREENAQPDVIEFRTYDETRIIPFETIASNDENLAKGEVRVIEGVNGSIVITFKEKIVNGKVVEIEEINRVVTPAINKQVITGTKEDVITTRRYQVVEEIDFETLEKDDPNLAKGEVRIIEGVKGSTTITYEEISVNGVVSETKEVARETVNPTNKEIIRGTKDVLAPTANDLPNIQAELKDNLVIEIPDASDDDNHKPSIRVEGLTDGLIFENNQIKGAVNLKGVYPIRVIYADRQGNETIKEFNLTIIEDADKPNNQLQAKEYEVMVNEEAVAENSIVRDSLSDVASIVWVNAPNTQAANDNASARVRVNFNDGSYLELDVNVKVKRAKIKPVIEILEVNKDVLKKKASVSYRLTDTDSTYVSAKAQLFKGEELVLNVAINDLNSELALTNLEYDVDYTLKTLLTYNLGSGNTEALEEDVEEFSLSLKRIELKHIDEARLYSYHNHRLMHHLSLENIPNNFTNYFVRIKSKQNKDIYLPIQSAKEKEVLDTTAFEFTANLDGLIQNVAGEYQENYRFYVAKTKAKTNDNQISSFRELVDKIKANPSGDFTIIQDISASEVELNAQDMAYIDNFSGRLTGEYQNKVYAIYDLKAPLFNTLNNANLSKLVFKDANITSHKHNNLATIASVANNSTLVNIAVEANISNSKNEAHRVAGLVATLNRSVMENIYFEGQIKSVVSQQAGDMFMGGIVAIADNTSRISKALVKGDLILAGHRGNHKAGLIVGHLKNGRLNNAYGEGKILNAIDHNAAQIGGIVGSTWPSGNVSDVVSAVKVTNGNQMHGDTNYGRANIRNSFVIENEVEGNKDKWSNEITKEAATQKLESYQIEADLELHNDFQRNNQYHVDYSLVEGANPTKLTAYHNLEKLMPFHNKELIVSYGNLIGDNDKLNQVAISDVVAMNNNQFIVDIARNKANINRILLHYQDGSTEYFTVNKQNDSVHPKVVEYLVADKNIIYTPEQFVDDYQNLIQAMSDFSSLNYQSDAIYNALNIGHLSDEQKETKLKDLYLDNRFDQVINKINDYLISILSQDAMINSESSAYSAYLKDRILAQKAELALALTYLDRWYNINYQDLSIKDLVLYKQDFYGNANQGTLESILNLAKLGYDGLHLKHNLASFALSKQLPIDRDELTEFLAYNKQLFAKDVNMDTWFKTSSKANIQEATSLVIPEHSVAVYSRITKKHSQFKNMVLPLLNLEKEDKVFIISTIASITFGLYDRYLDRSLEKTNPSKYNEEVTRVRKWVDDSTIRQRNHYDLWYRIVPANAQRRYLKDVPVWDDYLSPKGWLPQYDDTAQGILDFFGPLGLWHVKWNDSGAFANGEAVWFVHDKVLTHRGASVLSHEMVHNSDGAVYFHGHGRRQGMGAEAYALGMLQMPYNYDHAIFGVNFMYDFSADNQQERRLHAKNTDRYQTLADVDEYIKGMMDVIYVLNYAEAQAMLKYDKEHHKKWFDKLETINQYGTNIRRVFSDEEWDNMNLTSIDDLIDNDVIVKRGYQMGSPLTRNGYYTVNMFSPVYATAENPNGTPGDFSFRVTAFEVWAAKGYDGFLSYVSNKLKQESAAANEPVLSDSFVVNKIFDGQYPSFKAFKKDMYAQTVAKLDRLKAVDIRVGNTDYHIDTFAKMQQVIDAALADDITKNNHTNANKSTLQSVKSYLFNAYLRKTDDFRTSIFND